jgi:hypothetical protein
MIFLEVQLAVQGAFLPGFLVELALNFMSRPAAATVAAFALVAWDVPGCIVALVFRGFAKWGSPNPKWFMHIIKF